VIAPDIILDLIYDRSDWADHAMRLFDAIAADVEVHREDRPAYIAPMTVPMIYLLAQRSAGVPVARQVTSDLMRLLHVAPLGNYDYYDALSFSGFEYEDALQFVTCRCVGSKFLVTRSSFGRKRTPVQRRTAAEILPLFRK
jgi:hypothetical protein